MLHNNTRERERISPLSSLLRSPNLQGLVYEVNATAGHHSGACTGQRVELQSYGCGRG